MAKNIFGIESVHLDEMIQICMVQPMATEPLEWSGEQLAALTQYMASVQKQLSENPCALKGEQMRCLRSMCRQEPMRDEKSVR
jgi:hypothetical protein